MNKENDIGVLVFSPPRKPLPGSISNNDINNNNNNNNKIVINLDKLPKGIREREANRLLKEDNKKDNKLSNSNHNNDKNHHQLQQHNNHHHHHHQQQQQQHKSRQSMNSTIVKHTSVPKVNNKTHDSNNMIGKGLHTIDSKWAEKQMSGFTEWMNFVLSQGNHHDDEHVNIDDLNNTLNTTQHEPIDGAGLRQLLKRKVEAQIRQQVVNLYNSEKISTIISNITREVDEGRVVMRTDKDIHADLGLQDVFFNLLFSYEVQYLRLGLEAVFGIIISLPTKYAMTTGNVLKNHWKKALKTVILERLLNDIDIRSKFTKQMLLQNKQEQEMKKLLGKHVLKKFLSLVLILDATRNSGIFAVPTLFVRDSKIKTSKEIVTTFCRHFFRGEGDVIRHFSLLGYDVTFEQCYIHEYEYPIKNIATDLRDGVRLAKLLELLTKSAQLSSQLRVPAVSRLQKLHNVGIVLKALDEAISLPGTTPDPKDIVDGNRDRTLMLLWRMMYGFELKMLIEPKRVVQEVYAIQANQSWRRSIYGIEESANFAVSVPTLSSDGSITIPYTQTSMINTDNASFQVDDKALYDALVRWCDTIACQYGVPVFDLTTCFADGRILCLLIHYYHPTILPLKLIKKFRRDNSSNSTFDDSNDVEINSIPENSFSNLGMFLEVDSFYSPADWQKVIDLDHKNYNTVKRACKEIGGIPLMLPTYDSKNLPNEKTMLVFLGYLFARLVESSEQVRAAIRIQRVFRRVRKTMVKKATAVVKMNRRASSSAIGDVVITPIKSSKKERRSSIVRAPRQSVCPDAPISITISKAYAATIIKRKIRAFAQRKWYMRMKPQLLNELKERQSIDVSDYNDPVDVQDIIVEEMNDAVTKEEEDDDDEYSEKELERLAAEAREHAVLCADYEARLEAAEAARVLAEYAHDAIKSWSAAEEASMWEEKIALELTLQKAKDVEMKAISDLEAARRSAEDAINMEQQARQCAEERANAADMARKAAEDKLIELEEAFHSEQVAASKEFENRLASEIAFHAEQARLEAEWAATLKEEENARLAEEALNEEKEARHELELELEEAEIAARYLQEESTRLVEQAHLEAEYAAKMLAEENARLLEQARLENELALKAKAEENERLLQQARLEAELSAKALAEESARLLESARLEAEMKARELAEENARLVELARFEAEMKAKELVEENARLVEEARLQAELAAKAVAEEKMRLAELALNEEKEARRRIEEELLAIKQNQLEQEMMMKKAQEEARIAEEEARRKAELEAEEARLKAELEAEEARHKAALEAEEARRKAELEAEEARRQAELMAEKERKDIQMNISVSLCQAMWRKKLCYRKLKIMNIATTIIQRSWRKKILETKRKMSAEELARKRIEIKAASSIVRWYRFSILPIMRVHKLCHGFKRLQAYYHAMIIRRDSARDVKAAYKRIRKANEAAKADPTLKLGKLTTIALETLLSGKMISHLLKACQTLEFSTQVSSRCCHAFAKTHASSILFGLIRSCNRSTPHQELLKHALVVLLNVGRHKDLTPSVAEGDDCTDILIDLMQMFRDKRSIFCLAGELLCRLVEVSDNVKSTCNSTEFRKRLEGILHIMERKQRLDSKLKSITSRPPPGSNTTTPKGKGYSKYLANMEPIVIIQHLLHLLN